MVPAAVSPQPSPKPCDPEALATRARDLFLAGGLTCSQAMLQAGCEALGISNPLIPGIALGLGGGVGAQNLTCGILTGAALSVSAAVTTLRPELDRAETRRRVMGATATIVQVFQAENHHTDCRGICGQDLHGPGVTAQAKAAIRAHVCAPCLASCARVLAGALDEALADRPAGT
jgi:hypothetical protein